MADNRRRILELKRQKLLLEREREMQSAQEKPSEFESGLRGFAEGAAMGFQDELTGALESAFTDKTYEQARDESRAAYRAAREANPISYGAGNFAGGVGTAFIPGIGLAKGAGLAKTALNAALQGAATGIGTSEAEDAAGMAKDAAIGGAIGGAMGGAFKYGGDKLGKVLSRGSERAADALSDSAEKFAVKATGATGREAQQFAPGAGRELLSRKLVRFADSPEKIAERVGDAADEAGARIGLLMDDLDESGIKSSVDNIVANLEAKIKELDEVSGNEDIIRQIRNQIDSLYERGESLIPVSFGEKAKRNFQGKVNWASPEADKKSAAIISNAFKEESERAASEASPQIGNLFKERKKTFGLLSPIQKAAERRASTLNQSPIGGLGDIAAEAIADGKTLGATAIGRRIVAPRLASAMAISTDAIANLARSAPQRLGRFAPIIQQAAQRGSQAVAATNYILQQSQPEYREMLRQMDEEQPQE